MLTVTALLAAACAGNTEGGDPAALPPNAGDTPAAAGACLEGEPDCNDTGDMAAPGLPDSGGPVQDLPTTGLSVSEALASTVTDRIAVRGFLVVDDDGARLCDALAESYPPQCGGDSVPVVEYEEMVDVPLMEAQGVSWTDTVVTFCGELIDGVFSVDPTVSC